MNPFEAQPGFQDTNGVLHATLGVLSLSKQAESVLGEVRLGSVNQLSGCSREDPLLLALLGLLRLTRSPLGPLKPDANVASTNAGHGRNPEFPDGMLR